MVSRITNIAKNTSYFTLALVLQKVISFSYFTIIARALGPEDLGKYYFAISFATIFGIFIDLGLGNVLTREVARDKNKAGSLLGNILTIKITLAAFTLVALFFTANLMGYSELIRYLIYFSACCVVLDSFTANFYAVSRGCHNLAYESIASVLFQLIVLISGIVIINSNLGLLWLMLSLFSASSFNFIYSSFLIKNKFNISLRPKYDKHLFKLIVNIALPFALYGILQRFYIYFDTVLLAHFSGDKYVGIYQIAFKIIFALQFLPLAFTASLYPALSSYWQNNKQQLGVTFERAVNYLLIISIPIAIGIAVISDQVVLLFKSGFAEAVWPLRINMIALVFMFVAFPIGALLNACDKQRINTINMSITVATSIILNLILIPRWQAVGASLTVAITNIIMLILGFWWVPKIIDYKPWSILKVLGKCLAAASLMALAVFYLKQDLNIFITVILAGILYFILLFVFKAFSKGDIISIYQSFKKEPLQIENE